MNNVIDVNATPVQGQDPNQGQTQGAPQTPPPYQAPPPPYQAPPPPPPYQAPKTEPNNGYSLWAVISLIAGILNFKFPPFGAIAALITGYVARNEIKKSNGTMGGSGMATAGIVLGWVGIAFSLIVGVLFVLVLIGVISSAPLLCGSISGWLGTLP
jgi:hypothetical protein